MASLSLGGGSWYSNTLNLPRVGDRVWVKAPGYGFVGVGQVTGTREPMANFKIVVGNQERDATDLLKGATYHMDLINHPERMELSNGSMPGS